MEEMEFDIKSVLEMLSQVSSTENNQIRLFFLSSNKPTGIFFEGNLDVSVKDKLLENVLDFFNITDLPNSSQVLYDFKGKSNDDTIEILNIVNLPDLKTMINNAKSESTKDLTNLQFSKIKSIMIIIKSNQKELILLAKLKSSMFLEEATNGGLFTVKKDIIKTTVLSEKYIMTPMYYDICIYDDVVLLPTHSTTILNSIIALESFYQVAINEAVNLVEESELISNFEDFKIAVESQKSNKVLQKQFARLNSTKKIKFEALKKQYSEQKTIFVENFYILKEESQISIELDKDDKLIFDIKDRNQLIQILTLLMDAYSKTYMLHEITEQ